MFEYLKQAITCRFILYTLVVACFIYFKGGGILCKEFKRSDVPWVFELVTRCLVCVYYDECKQEDLKTAVCHGYHHINKRNKVLR